MFVLPIVAATFTIMSVFLTLPLLSLLSFQSIPTIDWCSLPSIAAYVGDLIDLGMKVAPTVTCWAVALAGFFVLALLVFLGYHAVFLGEGEYQLYVVEAAIVSKFVAVLRCQLDLVYQRSSTPILPPPDTPQSVASTFQDEYSLGDVTLVEELSSRLLHDPSLPKIVTLKSDISDLDVSSATLAPSSS